MNEIKRKLPADPGAMALGIIALLISLVGCCCGLFALPAIIMSLIGLIWAIKSTRRYKESPAEFSARSYSNINTAKVVNIIALVLSTLFLLFSLFIFGELALNPENIIKELEETAREIEREEGNIDQEEQVIITDTLIDNWSYNDGIDTVQTISQDSIYKSLKQ